MLHPQNWLTQFQGDSLNDSLYLSEIYGQDLKLLKERKKALIKLVSEFLQIFGSDRLCAISRAPARVNLMGRHIDHQGGFINTATINKEILLAFSPSKKGNIYIKNTNNHLFPEKNLSPHTLLNFSSYADWNDLTTSSEVKKINQKFKGDWSIYILAVYARLQIFFPDNKLKGFDGLVSGNIPIGSGLSSSAALIVAFAKALIHANNLQLSDKLLIELTGKCELFLGIRSGMGDQAAIISGRYGSINKIGFYPFHIAKTYPMPDNIHIIIAFSGQSAKKGEGAQSAYNQHVASYAIGFKMLQQFWPSSRKVDHIRDLTPRRLKLTTQEVLNKLLKLPKNPTRNKINDFFSNNKLDFLNSLYQTHEDPGSYDLIGTLLFGISECERSELFHNILESNKLNHLKSIISTSHDGDRVLNDSSPTINQIIEQNLSIENIPGNYGCSTKNIDQMVDIANAIPGVWGAQLAGAGMGGNIVILCKKEVAKDVLLSLKEKYYTPKIIPFDAHVCAPISGASILGYTTE